MTLPVPVHYQSFNGHTNGRDASSVTPSTATGGIRYADGVRPGVLEPTVNYWPNPSARFNVNGVGGGRYVNGDETAFEFTAAGAGTFGAWFMTLCGGVQPWTLSYDVWADTPNVERSYTAEAYSRSGVGQAVTLTHDEYPATLPVGQWTHVTTSFVTNAATVRVVPVLYFHGAINGSKIRVKNIQFENLDHETPLVDPSHDTASIWLGDEHNSPSQRRATSDRMIALYQDTTNWIKNPRGVGAPPPSWEVPSGASVSTAFGIRAPVDQDEPSFDAKRIVLTSAAWSSLMIWSDVPTGTTARPWVGTVWVNDGGFTLAIMARWWVLSATVVRDSPQFITPGDAKWHKYTLPLNTLAGDDINFGGINIAADWTGSGGQPAPTFHASHPHYEQSPYPTPYADGHMGDGFAFVGGVNDSRSTRARAHVSRSIPTGISSRRGSVVMTYRRPAGSTAEFGDYSRLMQMGSWGQVGGDAINLIVTTSGLVKSEMTVDGTAGNISIGAAGVPNGDVGVVYLEWDGPNARIKTLNGESTGTRLNPIGRVVADPLLRFGTAEGDIAILNGNVGASAFYARPLTDDEVDEAFALALAGQLSFPQQVRDVIRERETAERVFTVEPRLWLSDMLRNRYEQIPCRQPISASVTFNDDRAYKRQLDIAVLHPTTLQPLGDFVIPEIVINDQDDNQAVIPLGHFVVTDPDVETDTMVQTGSITAFDITYLMDLNTFDEPVIRPIGVDPAEWAVEQLIGWGLTVDQVDIPSAGVLTTVEKYHDEGSSLYDVVNDAMHAGGLINVETDDLGRVTSRKSGDLAGRPAEVVYSSDDGARLGQQIKETRDLSRLRNRVTVRKKSTTEPTISVTLDVTDESSPVHPRRLQELMKAPKPVIIGHTVDDNDIVDETTALAVAENLISLGASFYQKLNIVTLIEAGFDRHRVIGLDVHDGPYVYYSGTWLRRAWSIKMSGITATLEHELNHIERWR